MLDLIKAPLFKVPLFKMIAGALVVLALGAVLYIVLARTYNAGYEAGSASVLVKWNTEKLKYLELNRQLTEQVAIQQHALDTQATEFERKSHEEKQSIIDDYKQRVAAVNRGVQRVYIPVKSTGCGDTSASGSPVTATPPGDALPRAELDDQTYAALRALTRDGDIAIIERNEMIERYNAARAALLALQAQQQQQQTKNIPTP